MTPLDLDALEKLTEAARDVCAESWGEVRGGHATGDLIWRLAEALPALIKRVRELEEALAPFAAVAEHDIGDTESDTDIFVPMGERSAHARRLMCGDLRRAGAILHKEGGEG